MVRESRKSTIDNQTCTADLVYAVDWHAGEKFTETSTESIRPNSKEIYEPEEFELYRAAYMESYSSPSLWSNCFGCFWQGIGILNEPACFHVTISTRGNHDGKTDQGIEERILECGLSSEQEPELIC